MKKLLGMLVIASSLVGISSLQADPWEGFYVEAFGGANWIQTNKNANKHRGSSDESFDGSTSGRKQKKHKLEFDTGYIVGGAIGYRLCNGLRFEGEVSYRRNQLKKFKDNKDQHYACQDHKSRGHFQSISYMANLLYDFDLSAWDCCCWNPCYEIVPYLGVGIGYDNQKFKRSQDEHFDVSGRRHKNDDKNGFAWQVIVGLGYEIDCNADVALEYRFHQGREERLYNHSLDLAAKYHF